MAIEDLLWWRGRVGDSPVEHGGLSNQPNCCFRHPFPKYDVFVVDVRFNLLFRFDIENL